MLQHVKPLIRRSPVGPLAVRLYRLCFRPPLAAEDPLADVNARYDRETVAVMERALAPDASAIDIGAHTGDILRKMLQVAPDGAHLAFEPLPDFASRLQAQFPGVRVHQAAVGETSGTATFVHVENDPMYSGLRERIYDRPDRVLRRITVEVVRIDDVVPHGQHVAFIKLDVEGGEFHALLGALETIRRCRPIIVFEAGQRSTGQYGVTPEAMYDLFADRLGYHVSTMQRWLAGEPPWARATWCDNWHAGPEFYFIGYPPEHGHHPRARTA